MANFNRGAQKAKNQQNLQDSLMADMYFGTPVELDNNSGEFNLTAQNPPQNQSTSITEENQVQ